MEGLTGGVVRAARGAGGAGGVCARAGARLATRVPAPLRRARARVAAGRVHARAAVGARGRRALVDVALAPAGRDTFVMLPYTRATRGGALARHSQLPLEAGRALAAVGGHQVAARGAVLALVRGALVDVHLQQHPREHRPRRTLRARGGGPGQVPGSSLRSTRAGRSRSRRSARRRSARRCCSPPPGTARSPRPPPRPTARRNCDRTTLFVLQWNEDLDYTHLFGSGSKFL